MTEQELRQLVRDAIARAGAGRVLPEGAVGRVLSDGAVGRVLSDSPTQLLSDPAFALLSLPVGGDGPCIIEPAVPCNHCGYCKSYGH